MTQWRVSVYDSSHAQLIQQNGQKLLSILKYVVFCGKQNSLLRGHGDDDKILEAADSEHNPGNFKAILNLRVESGDKMLQDHLARVGKNATYTSKTIQNELIEVTRDRICQTIIDKATNPFFYTVLADKVDDVSDIEQWV